jgi:undecaprenyl-diphosphatase
VNFFQALLLGIVEGVTEFLPVSSTAHLILASNALKLPDTNFLKSFEIIIQFGAILSVVLLYWSRFWKRDIFLKLVIAFIPTGIIGLTVYKIVKGYLLGNLTVTLWSLIVGGVLLIVFERFNKPGVTEADFSEITYRKAFAIGIFQTLAMIPGVSRSAATIIGGSAIGISRRTIVEFSFLLAVPTMLAASVLELIKGQADILSGGNIGVLAVGFIVSFVTAVLAIKSFVAFIKRRDFTAFGLYRIAVAVAYYFAFLR